MMLLLKQCWSSIIQSGVLRAGLSIIITEINSKAKTYLDETSSHFVCLITKPGGVIFIL